MICVAGMPRSGTSLVTQLLHRCGLNVGPPEELMPASINNTDGFWENLKFVRLNERLLAANGGMWFAPPATLHATPKITADAKAIIARFDGQEPWGWKDPRNALTLPFWKELLPSMKVLVCVRHPSETASSLAASTMIPRLWWPFYWPVTRRDSPLQLRESAWPMHKRFLDAMRSTLSFERRRELVRRFGVELWRVYNTTILAETNPTNRLVTHYEAVLTNPRAELQRILAFAEMDVSSDVLDEALRVVSPRMRHQRADAPLNAELARLYAELCDEASTARNISA